MTVYVVVRFKEETKLKKLNLNVTSKVSIYFII